jgi:hypothetical protein
VSSVPVQRTAITEDHNYTNGSIAVTAVSSSPVISTNGVNDNHYNNHFLMKQSHSLPLETHNNLNNAIMTSASSFGGDSLSHTNGICHDEEGIRGGDAGLINQNGHALEMVNGTSSLNATVL